MKRPIKKHYHFWWEIDDDMKNSPSDDYRLDRFDFQRNTPDDILAVDAWIADTLAYWSGTVRLTCKTEGVDKVGNVRLPVKCRPFDLCEALEKVRDAMAKAYPEFDFKKTKISITMSLCPPKSTFGGEVVG